MEDNEILDLYFERSEDAISETNNKYGKYCKYIANNILHNQQDVEECVNDTYIKLWNTIPPNRPKSLSAFLGKIVRNIALNKYERNNADKRGCGQVALVIDELNECIPNNINVEFEIESITLTNILNQFLASLDVDKRKIFIRRYWYLNSIKDIAHSYGISESKVKMSLLRSRNKLKKVLEKEGFYL